MTNTGNTGRTALGHRLKSTHLFEGPPFSNRCPEDNSSEHGLATSSLQFLSRIKQKSRLRLNYTEISPHTSLVCMLKLSWDAHQKGGEPQKGGYFRFPPIIRMVSLELLRCPLRCPLGRENEISEALSARKLQRFLRFAIAMPIADPRNRRRFPRQDKAMLHCDLGVRWKVASDLRIRVAISESETPLSAGVLAIWLRQRGNRQRLRLCDFGALR